MVERSQYKIPVSSILKLGAERQCANLHIVPRASEPISKLLNLFMQNGSTKMSLLDPGFVVRRKIPGHCAQSYTATMAVSDRLKMTRWRTRSAKTLLCVRQSFPK